MFSLLDLRPHLESTLRRFDLVGFGPSGIFTLNNPATVSRFMTQWQFSMVQFIVNYTIAGGWVYTSFRELGEYCQLRTLLPVVVSSTRVLRIPCAIQHHSKERECALNTPSGFEESQVRESCDGRLSLTIREHLSCSER